MPYGLKIFALSRTVMEIEANLCFAIFGKIQNGCHFWGGGKFLEKIFLKIAKSTFLRCPVG